MSFSYKKNELPWYYIDNQQYKPKPIIIPDLPELPILPELPDLPDY